MLGEIKVGPNQPVRVMGVINLTRNSFYGDSVSTSDEDILSAGLRIENEGGCIIDVGARSTAPYRRYDISESAELKLAGHALKILSKNLSKAELSIDTSRLSVAKTAFDEGASILNDVSGLSSNDGKKLARLVSRRGGSAILCAHERRRKTGDPYTRVSQSLLRTLKVALTCGLDQSNIVIDPAVGFFSDRILTNVQWNLSILLRLDDLSKSLGLPVCVGVSRKRFIGNLIGDKTPSERLYGSIAASALAVYEGAHMLRTHDVRETVDSAKVASALRGISSKSVLGSATSGVHRKE